MRTLYPRLIASVMSNSGDESDSVMTDVSGEHGVGTPTVEADHGRRPSATEPPKDYSPDRSVRSVSVDSGITDGKSFPGIALLPSRASATPPLPSGGSDGRGSIPFTMVSPLLRFLHRGTL